MSTIQSATLGAASVQSQGTQPPPWTYTNAAGLSVELVKDPTLPTGIWIQNHVDSGGRPWFPTRTIPAAPRCAADIDAIDTITKTQDPLVRLISIYLSPKDYTILTLTLTLALPHPAASGVAPNVPPAPMLAAIGAPRKNVVILDLSEDAEAIKRCDCGAAKIGVQPHRPGHSSWCSVA